MTCYASIFFSGLHQSHFAQVFIQTLSSSFDLKPPALNQLSSDWLHCTNRRFKQHVGGATLLPARVQAWDDHIRISALFYIIKSERLKAEVLAYRDYLYTHQPRHLKLYQWLILSIHQFNSIYVYMTGNMETYTVLFLPLVLFLSRLFEHGRCRNTATAPCCSCSHCYCLIYIFYCHYY